MCAHTRETGREKERRRERERADRETETETLRERERERKAESERRDRERKNERARDKESSCAACEGGRQRVDVRELCLHITNHHTCARTQIKCSTPAREKERERRNKTRGGGLGSRPIFKKINKPYAPS